MRLRAVPKFREHSFLFAPVSYAHPAVQIRGGTFYKQHGVPGSQQEPLFKDLALTIGHPAIEQWAIVGPAGAGKTTLLELLRGQHVCEPASARTFPAITAAARVRGLPHDPLPLIQYLPATGREGLLAGAAAQGAYMSARYESGLDPNDLTLSDYLTGNLSLNPDPTEKEDIQSFAKSFFYRTLLEKLQLTELANQPLSTLSNGQTRRARIARALVPRPAMLMLDEPFLGLDPDAQRQLSYIFRPLTTQFFLSLVCAFEDDHTIPKFITHILYINSQHEIVASGPRHAVHKILRGKGYNVQINIRRKVTDLDTTSAPKNGAKSVTSEWFSQMDAPATKADTEAAAADRPVVPAVIEMSGVRVRYGEKLALGAWNQETDGEERPGLWWKVRQGERWGVFGANGAGKTTLLSLINSDHPQAYGQPVKVFGRGRLPTVDQPALPVFELQSRIGQASPEIHNFFPRNLTVRQTLESAWAETFRASPQLTYEDDSAIDATLRWFQPLLDPTYAQDIPGAIEKHANELRDKKTFYIRAYREGTNNDWADAMQFGELDFASQRVALFLRAVVRKQELIILDEAFGGMTQVARTRCMLWLAYGERRIVQPQSVQGVVRTRSSSLERGVEDRGATGNALVVDGLEPRQTLLCVAHRRDDVPPILNKWIMLPPDGGRQNGKPPRVGTLNFAGTKWKIGRWWETLWWDGGRSRDWL